MAMSDKPRSRNPFLDQPEDLEENASLQKPLSPAKTRARASPPIQSDSPRNLIDPFVSRMTLHGSRHALIVIEHPGAQ